MSQTTSDPVAQFDALLAKAEFLFVIYYRGHWCPFCISYLKSLQNLSPSITAANGIPLIVTAEAASHLPTTISASGYTGETIVDPANALAKELKSRGLLDVAISEKKGYEHGMAQPAVLVVKKDGKVLFDWAIVPSLMNVGGATDRPSLKQVWDNVEAQSRGQPPLHKKFASTSIAGLLREKVFG